MEVWQMSCLSCQNKEGKIYKEPCSVCYSLASMGYPFSMYKPEEKRCMDCKQCDPYSDGNSYCENCKANGKYLFESWKVRK